MTTLRLRPRSTAFTLVEILTVLGIIAVLLAIVLPVMAHSRRMAKRRTCISNLRHVGMAIRMYEQDYEALPAGLSHLTAYLGDKRILLCPEDTTKVGQAVGEWGSLISASEIPGIPFSYVYAKSFLGSICLNHILSEPADGLVVCNLHGTNLFPGLNGQDGFYGLYSGILLRLRLGGGVSIRKWAPIITPNGAYPIYTTNTYTFFADDNYDGCGGSSKK